MKGLRRRRRSLTLQWLDQSEKRRRSQGGDESGDGPEPALPEEAVDQAVTSWPFDQSWEEEQREDSPGRRSGRRLSTSSRESSESMDSEDMRDPQVRQSRALKKNWMKRQSTVQNAMLEAKLQQARKDGFRAFVSARLARGEDVSWVEYGEWLVNSDRFDYCVGALLLLNAFCIGVQANYFANNRDPHTPMTFRVIDSAFCVTFGLELSLRVFVYRCAFLTGEGRRWNLFDVLLFFFQVVDEVLKIIFSNSEAEGVSVMDSFGVIRMLRLARLLRLVRMVRLIPELKSMVYLISASISSFVWSAILIGIMMYFFAIYYTEIMTDMITEGSFSHLQQTDLEHVESMWGSVPHSVLSLWMAITGGDDWRNLIEIFKKDGAYVLHMLFFVVYIAFGTLVMLNLVTGVFVEGAQRIIKEDKDSELLTMAARLFQRADQDSSQDITWEEFAAQLEAGEMDDYIKAVGIGINEAEHLYELLDTDQSGTLSLGEFVKGCLRLRGPAKSMDMAELEYQMKNRFNRMERGVAQIGEALQKHTKESSSAMEMLSQGISNCSPLLLQQMSEMQDAFVSKCVASVELPFQLQTEEVLV